MSSEITDKTHVIVVQGVGRIYVNKAEADAVKQTMVIGEAQTVVVGDNFIRVNSINAIVPASEIQNLDRYRQGDFRCNYGTWHSKGMQCNCAEAKRLGML